MVEETTKEAQIEVDPEPEVVQDEKAALREKNKLKKRAQRARDKAKKDLKAAKEQEAKLKDMSNAEWFETNRATLTPAARAEYEARSLETYGLEVDMADVIGSRLRRLPESERIEYEPSDEQFDDAHVKKLVQRVEAYVEKYGTYLDGTMRENIVQFREYFTQWSLHDRATRDTLTYGYLLGVGTRILNDFRIVTSPEGYEHRCATCHSITYRRSEHRPPPDWRCPPCEVKHRERVAQAQDHQRQQEKMIAESEAATPFDKYGRRVL